MPSQRKWGMERTQGPPGPDEFTNFYRGNYPRVVAYVQRRSRLDAEAVAADVFATAWVKRQAALSLGLPWLYRTAYLEIQNQRRAAATASRSQLVGVRSPSPDHAEEASQHLWMRSLLDKLSHQDQEVLRLLYWEDLDHDSAAIALNCRAGTVAVRAHRARKRLARLINQQSNEQTSPPTPSGEQLGSPPLVSERQTGVTRS